MKSYETILWILTAWTVGEGVMLLAWPGGAKALTKKCFSKWGAILEGIPGGEMRKLGAVELAFGLLLGGYLLWAA